MEYKNLDNQTSRVSIRCAKYYLYELDIPQVFAEMNNDTKVSSPLALNSSNHPILSPELVRWVHHFDETLLPENSNPDAPHKSKWFDDLNITYPNLNFNVTIK